ncbi:MAG: DNA polymerase III subunit alpha [Marinilabiliales bacterium]|nr:MAG: DNA polymerase III subunit alpha [Marinilabiliales bacterium]
MTDFVHLHVHTQYSILDGASKIPLLIAKAKQDGMPAIAITDHGNMFGVKEFFNVARKEGVKPILGCETYVAARGRNKKEKQEDRSGFHLILLAKNHKGYKNLVKLISLSWMEGFYYKPRIDWELLEKYHEGLVATSACLAGEIPKAIQRGELDEAIKTTNRFKSIFGEDFYLELMRHETNRPGADRTVYEEQKKVNVELVKIAEKTGVKLIATNDVHFVNSDDAEAHDRLICLTTNSDVNDENRLRYTKQEWLKTKAEMHEVFNDIPQALENTIEIANKIEDYELDSQPIMPVFEIPDSFATEEEYQEKFEEKDLKEEFEESNYARIGSFDKAIRVKLEADYLAHLVYEGCKERYGEDFKDSLKERVDFELGTIKKMGFPGYFLIVWDFLRAAREMGVSVGPGRGSAAGSVVAYALQITNIDPIKYDLLFERFLNPDRISMPDIDIDFDEDGREKVLKWVVDKYGYNRVAHIITFGKMAPKMAIRDVARVQQLELSEADRLAKLVPERPGTSFAKAYKEVPELAAEKKSENALVAQTLEFAEVLEGSVRQTGVHACGVIISKEDLTEYIPVCTNKDANLAVTQFDGSHVESVGMLKMDFLGLKTLSIIKDALENIKKNRGIDIDIEAIPLDDKKTFELYSRGDTVGLFQFESAGMQKHLKELKPNRFGDLIAMNALYRPGPMEYIPQYIDRKHGREKIAYDLEDMAEFLEDTYGITVYQEQVMLLSRKLAGFTRGEADKLRKAMGKKIKPILEELKPKFIEGGKAKNHDEKILEKIWNDWEAFASYAFNKSHSTCYAYVSYQTGYLKAHYAAEFMAAVLSRNQSDLKKITIFMDECRRMGVKVLGPDVNESDVHFTVNKDGNIRFGMNAVKGVGEAAVKKIIEEREKNGLYKDIYDFVERVNLQAVNKRCVEALAMAGGFDGFLLKRNQYFNLDQNEASFIEQLLLYGNRIQSEKNSPQASLFGDAMAGSGIAKPEVPKSQEWTVIDRLNKEKELIGIFLSAHPLDAYKIELGLLNNVSLSELKNLQNLEGKDITVAGIVTEVKSATTKTGKPFGGVTIEDYSNSYQLMLFGKDYLNFNKFFVKDYLIYIKGKVEKRRFGKNEKELEFRVKSFGMLADVREDFVDSLSLKIPVDYLTSEFIQEIDSIAQKHKGNTMLKFLLYDRVNRIWVEMFSRSHRLQLNNDLINYLESNEKIEYKIS